MRTARRELMVFKATLLTLIFTIAVGAQTSLSLPDELNGAKHEGASVNSYPEHRHQSNATPYTALQVTRHKQLLLDGTHIDQLLQKTSFYRDSNGRTRFERVLMPTSKSALSKSAAIQIKDPVSGYQFELDPQNRVATRIPLPRQAPEADESKLVPPQQPDNTKQSMSPSNGTKVSAIGGIKMAKRSLGSRVIHGVKAQGSEVDMTYPQGYFGNDRPLMTHSETWVSQSLKLLLEAKVSDPRTGELFTEIDNISLVEPDPNLFKVPPDFSIVDAK